MSGADVSATGSGLAGETGGSEGVYETGGGELASSIRVIVTGIFSWPFSPIKT